jgi:hypothetical protein
MWVKLEDPIQGQIRVRVEVENEDNLDIDKVDDTTEVTPSQVSSMGPTLELPENDTNSTAKITDKGTVVVISEEMSTNLQTIVEISNSGFYIFLLNIIFSFFECNTQPTENK